LGLTNLEEMGANSLIGGKFFLNDNLKKIGGNAVKCVNGI